MDALVVRITIRKVNFVLDADIQSYFDTVNQAWLIRFLKHRINDPRMIRLIQKWLKAGILEDGIVTIDETRSFARDIGFEPRTTPIESPQSNGRAEAFVRTIKRDYVHVSSCPNAQTVMHQLSAWINHCNEVHPHKALGYRSPREFIAAHGSS
jgi:putative transposase